MRLLEPVAQQALGKKILAELEGEIAQELEVVVEETVPLAVPGPGQPPGQHPHDHDHDQQGQGGGQRTQQSVVTNDFAAELLYVMRAAGDMLGD